MGHLLKNLFIAFISGTCSINVIHFYYGFNSLKNQYNKENMKKVFGQNPYVFYTMIAPLYFGIMSTISILFSSVFKIYFRYVFFIMSIISASLVQLFIKYFDIYNFTEERWKKQYFYLILFHTFTYNIIIANIYYNLI